MGRPVLKPAIMSVACLPKEHDEGRVCRGPGLTLGWLDRDHAGGPGDAPGGEALIWHPLANAWQAVLALLFAARPPGGCRCVNDF